MRTTAFFAIFGRIHGDNGLADQIIQFEGFNQVGIPDHGGIRYLHVLNRRPDLIDFTHPFFKHFSSAENGTIVLHDLLHVQTNFRRWRVATCVSEMIESCYGLVIRAFFETGN